MRSPTQGEVTAQRLREDDAVWDAFVAAAPLATHLQTTSWASVKQPNGWTASRVVVEAPGGPIGAQLLALRARPLPWSFGYAPRGPLARRELTHESIDVFTTSLRRGAARRRISHVRIDPEVEEGHPLAGWLAAAGWQRAPDVQPNSTRIVDLRQTEEQLWSALRKKTRQSVNRARKAGIRVTEGGEERLDDFFRIYTETARRAGIPYRTAESYRRIWEAFGPKGTARFVIGETSGGEPIATSFIVTCGTRVFGLYGGMTSKGAELYANYLVKWEAIARCRAEGFTEYDMWGLPNAGIAWFKSGFGGRDARFIGAWDLVIDPVGRATIEMGGKVRSRLADALHRLRDRGRVREQVETDAEPRSDERGGSRDGEPGAAR